MWKTIENLDKYLEVFERNFSARGGKVIWAENTEEAQKRHSKDTHFKLVFLK